MMKKLEVRWSRRAGKVMRAKLRDEGVRVSESVGPVTARLELVVEADGKVTRVLVPDDYVLLSSADWAAIKGRGDSLL